MRPRNVLLLLLLAGTMVGLLSPVETQGARFTRSALSKKPKKKALQNCPSQFTDEEFAKIPENSTSSILTRLLRTYDPRIRPNFKGIPVDVKVNIFINSFGTIRETTMDYRVNIFIRQQWNDPRLQIPDHIRGVETLTLDPALIRCMWRPDLFFANEKKANFHSVTKQNTLLFVSGNGDILMSMRLSLTLSCPMDLTLFPMDTQRCKMQLESFGYTTDDLIFNWAAGEPVQMEKMSLPQFDISQKDIVYGNCTKYYKGTGYYTCVEVIFTLRRQVGFYIMGIYAPTLLLVVLSWLTFWINPEASPARVSLGILSILSLFSQSMSLATDLPKVSYVKALDIWLLTCLIYGFASLVQYAIVQICLNNPRYIAAEKQRKELKEKQRKRIMPPGANDDRVWTISTRNGTPTAPRGARRVCMSRSDLRTGDFSIVGSLPRDFDLTNYDCYGKPIGGVGPGGAGLKGKGPAKPPAKQIVPFEAKRVDHYSRALFPITFFFFNIIYWSVYL